MQCSRHMRQRASTKQVKQVLDILICEASVPDVSQSC